MSGPKQVHSRSRAAGAAPRAALAWPGRSRFQHRVRHAGNGRMFPSGSSNSRQPHRGRRRWDKARKTSETAVAQCLCAMSSRSTADAPCSIASAAAGSGDVRGGAPAPTAASVASKRAAPAHRRGRIDDMQHQREGLPHGRLDDPGLSLA